MNEKLFTFGGTATVSVSCRIEAVSETQARAMIRSGDVEWVCDEVDGDVGELELLLEEES